MDEVKHAEYIEVEDRRCTFIGQLTWEDGQQVGEVNWCRRCMKGISSPANLSSSGNFSSLKYATDILSRG
ncbi:hypothetical protein E2C01_085330 [Portunus trituberculatus]|uniref:Uncharacterized protein n=1 Tax=Portunus trituberculatus TaxID=210409 RepID=A0A5B7J0P3_PORTR|nr:hypothetical protein [Portunus trituberculatus]